MITVFTSVLIIDQDYPHFRTKEAILLFIVLLMNNTVHIKWLTKSVIDFMR